MLKSLYFDVEYEDGYFWDQFVFGDGISIEDMMNLLVRYKNGVVMMYFLIVYVLWEGLRVNFNGIKGWIEMEVVENSYVNLGGDQLLEGCLEWSIILLRLLFELFGEVEIGEVKGVYGGGDNVLLQDLFGVLVLDEYMRVVSYVDGVVSILMGIVVNRFIVMGQVVFVDDILKVFDNQRRYNFSIVVIMINLKLFNLICLLLFVVVVVLVVVLVLLDVGVLVMEEFLWVEMGMVLRLGLVVVVVRVVELL